MPASICENLDSFEMEKECTNLLSMLTEMMSPNCLPKRDRRMDGWMETKCQPNTPRALMNSLVSGLVV